MVYISLLQHSDQGVMATWPITGEYCMMTLWLYLSNSVLLEGGWWAFKDNPYSAQITGLLIEVADSKKQSTFGPLFL